MTTSQPLAIVVLVVGSLLLFALINSIIYGQSNTPSGSSIRRNRQLAIKLLDPKSVTLRSDSPIEYNNNNNNNNWEFLKLLKETEEIWTRVPLEKNLPPAREAKAMEVATAAKKVQALEQRSVEYAPALTVCGRDFPQHKPAACPAAFTKATPILVLEGLGATGRTGNNLVELLHGIQYARDNNIQLGIMSDSWATRLITTMWMENKVGDDWSPAGDWQAQVETILCAKIFSTEEELEGWDVIHKGTGWLFEYKTTSTMGDYMANQLDILRRIFTHYNAGEGIDRLGRPTRDMCSAINTIFGMDSRKSAIYSAIHSRSMEGHPGIHHLKVMSQRSGCDRSAALEMHPDYIKSILQPLGMLQYPIVFITDGENPLILNRLLADPDIGGLIRVVPSEASWIGGDIALAVASNVFIGNPASSFGNFIAKSRLALGMGHNELFKAKDENGQWRTVCGDHCLFDVVP
mmetsp:Transcript_36944/g.66450  ORF Transcript_36944/g.66450 Transcript_36944/m.66450 type:complete len:462 (-) Transcript_36944:40-1425(-)